MKPLKPCPFCRSDQVIMVMERTVDQQGNRKGGDVFHALCAKCNTPGPRHWSMSTAAKKWNSAARDETPR